ncbi:MAG: DUF1292 domain-containing protein [Clostridia bacterium]|nr:DUF1292 domain-containing protein [Clostridia bacterium]
MAKNGKDVIDYPTTELGKHKVALSFYRFDEEKDAQPAVVRALEFFYNLVFLIRRIAVFLLPVLAVAGIVVSIIKKLEGLKTAAIFILVDFAIWIACIITEGILSRCAAAKLKAKTSVVKPKNSGKNNRFSSSLSKHSSKNQTADDDDDVITLTSKNGEEIDFVEIAGIHYRGNFYAILQPIELLEGMEDDEALVFKVSRNAGGEDNFEVELNDDIIDAVFVEYNKLLDEAEKNDKKSSAS